MASGNPGVTSSGASSSVGSSGKVTQKLNLVKAATYKPPRTVMFHEPKEDRIRCFYGPNRIGRSCGLAVGLDTALRVVLKLAWGLHTRAHPTEECPWDFGSLEL